jgi:hypothetical protein
VNSPKQRYLTIIAAEPTSTTAPGGSDLPAYTIGNRCAEWDDVDWDTLGEGMKRKNIRCSTIIVEIGEEDPVIAKTRRKKLRRLCEEASSDKEAGS